MLEHEIQQEERIERERDEATKRRIDDHLRDLQSLCDALLETRSLKCQRDELLAALKESRESIEDWAGYASEYFREKHKLAEELAALGALIARMEEGK